jgi:hypothetical protein
MTTLATKEDWKQGPQDDIWRHALSLPIGAKRLQMLAIFTGRVEAAPPWLELPPDPARRRLATRTIASYLVVEDLPAHHLSHITVACAVAPEKMTWRADISPAPGLSGAGVFPRCWGPARNAFHERIFDMDSALAHLAADQLDEALTFAARLCLAGEQALLAQFMSPLAEYVNSHPLNRGDNMGLFVAAVSGVRSQH